MFLPNGPADIYQLHILLLHGVVSPNRRKFRGPFSMTFLDLIGSDSQLLRRYPAKKAQGQILGKPKGTLQKGNFDQNGDCTSV